ncbi:MAG: gliding motility-associated C-terminal domain-containing protein, partial [Saprospiraceae bacterium]
ISVLADDSTFLISIVPNKTIERPFNITNTGQITLKALAGSFDISDVKSFTGIWQLNTIIEQPIEAPNFDYIVFTLVTPIQNPSYRANIDLPFFSFKNKNGCIGSIQLINNFTDNFWPPNSLDVNIGNQLTILEYGINNAYEKNHPFNSIIDCPSTLEVDFLVEALKCAGGKTSLKILLHDGVVPFHYELTLADGVVKKDSLLSRGDSVILNIPVGIHQFLGFDKLDSLYKNLEIDAPPPLQIDIIQQEEITCHTVNGVSVTINGQGGRMPQSFQYHWSNGGSGKEMADLLAGSYMVTLTDENKCSTTKEIIIAASPLLTIDSIETYPPTCHDEKDGMIELVQIKNGIPPYRYALDKSNYQSENYFTNLSSGTYQLNVTDGDNCVTTERVTLANPPKLSFLEEQIDTILSIGQSTQLMPMLTESTNLYYNWTPNTFLSCSDCPNPIASPRSTTTYTLVVNNQLGCETSITSQIKVLEKHPIFAPNVFSPNNDHINDLFEIFIGPTIDYGQHLQIFNRWGQLVYAMKNNDKDSRLNWDGYIQGKPADSGIYIYIAKLQLKNGNSEIQKGDFFLLK